ncbi:MAG: DinB family protein [Chloroflexota bacterium]|nr:DinB family protein [Chloroflexota bacterium]
MAGPAVDVLLYLLEEAFDGRGIEESNESSALLTNLATVDEATWRATAPGATRTIESMVLHVGACKVMYADYAFGPGTKQWGTREVEPWADGEAPMAEAIEWLRRTHRSFVEHIAGLTDDDLDHPRMTNWGELRPTRWIIAALVGHDFYHAGEINHLRSLMGTDDRWRWQQLEAPAG